MKIKKHNRIKPLSFISIICLCIFFSSCNDDSDKRNLEIPIIQGPTTPFIYELPNMLISEIYKTDINDSLILTTKYEYDSTYKLIRRTNYLVEHDTIETTIIDTYTYENNRLTRMDNDKERITPNTNYSDNYYIIYSYNNLGYLTESNCNGYSTLYQYNQQGQLCLSYTEDYKELYENYRPNSLFPYAGDNPLLWSEYIYQNDNVTVSIYTFCENDVEEYLFYDLTNKASAGLDYIPEGNIFPSIYNFNHIGPSLSKSNITKYDNQYYNETYSYEYNQYNYPTKITKYENSIKKAEYEIVYIIRN